MKRNRLLLTIILIAFIMNISNIYVFAADTENSSDDSVSADVSQINSSELLYDEDGYLLGCQPDPEEHLHQYLKGQSVIPDRTTLPSSCDLSQDIYFPPIGDQGNVGSCTSWAATYYQFTYQVARLNNWNAKTNSYYRFSPRWTYNFCNNGINEGASLIATYMILKNTGAARWSEFPSSGSNTTTEYRKWCTVTDVYKNALQYRVSSLLIDKYEDDDTILTPIKSPNNSGLLTMKNHINSGHILAFSSKWNTPVYKSLSSQYDSSLNGKSVIVSLNNTNTTNKGHALTIVGYDDNIWYDLNNNNKKESFEKGAFKVANSHGTSYQNSGYVWLMYDALNQKSNANILNTPNRESFIKNYVYYKIEVAKCDLLLTSEVTINHTYRNEIELFTAPTMLNYSWYYDSFLKNNGGNYNFVGQSGNNTATFAFDFGNMPDAIERRNVYLLIKDGCNNSGSITNVPTKIQRLKLIDKTGKTVVDDTEERTINNCLKYYGYRIGMVGDTDNNASVNITDATSINQYLAGLMNLTSEDLIVSDTDADNSVTIMDVTHLQRYLVRIIPNMNNGIYASLN